MKPGIIQIWQAMSLRVAPVSPARRHVRGGAVLGAVLLRSFAIGAVDRGKRAGGALGRADCRSAQRRAAILGQSAADAGCVRPIARDRRRPAIPPRRSGPSGAFALQPSSTAGRAPRWFVDILAVPEMGAVFPVMIDGKRVGDIVFDPDMSADIYEKWIGFLAILVSAVGLGAADRDHRLRHGGRRPRAFARPRGRAHPAAARKLRGAHHAGRAARDPPERRGSQRTGANLEPVEPGQPQPVAQDRVAAGRRTARSGAGTSR